MSDTRSESVEADAAAPAYATLLELGRGGMGSAALACATGLGGFERLVVIKRLRKELTGDERAIKRILAEARLAASIHHANVVATQHTGVDEQGPFLVLDYVEGASLEELVDASRLRGAPLPLAVCLRIALDVLSGLSAIHGAHDSRGRPLDILHRDLSLQNVLVGRDGVARIADFGIAKSALASGMTDEGYLIGKLHYLSPEYLRRESVGPAMDVYALGVTLWLAVTGKSLWSGASDGQVMHAILSEGIPRASAVMHIHPAVDELLARACAPWPEMRYETARVMSEEIEHIQREAGLAASHREVAETLESLVGGELDQRRKLVASMLEQQGRVGGAGVPDTGRAARAKSESAISAKSSDIPPATKSRKWVLATSLGTLAFSTVSALVAMAIRNDASSPTVSAAPSTSAAAPSPALRAPVAPQPSVFPVASEAAPAVSSAVAATPSAVAPKSAPARRRAATTASPAREARAPDDIKAKNPYRRPQ